MIGVNGNGITMGKQSAPILLCLTLVMLLCAAPAIAEVTEIEIRDRRLLAGGITFGDAGPYERVSGRLHYAVDPLDPANARIADLKFAPRDADGRVSFAGDFILIKPRRPELGNGRLIYGVNNRGNLVLLRMLNDAPWTNDPSTASDLGNGFLLDRGYSLLWSAWNWDVASGGGRLQIDLPVATDGGRPITGPVAAEMTTDRPTDILPVAWGNSIGYAPADPDTAAARLTVREAPLDRRRGVPRDRWRFVTDTDPGAPVRVVLDGGFRPGSIYELVYRARDPRVVGLGLAGLRDALSFFRFARADARGRPNPLASANGKPTVEGALIYGFSQSARVIQHMLMEGLHVDERGRAVFDAALVHGPGAGKGAFNHRFAQTTRHPSHHEDHLYPADVFPFTTVQDTDPLTGENGSLLDRAHALGAVPLLFYVSTATEYWTRAASLLHTDVSAARDVAPSPRTRLYAVSGAQHGVGAAARRGIFESCPNPLDYRPVLRALLVALDQWATDARPPPASMYPTIAAGSLGTVVAYQAALPAIPGLRTPDSNLRPSRLNLGAHFASEGIVDIVPPQPGPPFATLVPQPDPDGLDRGGIRLPAVAVPLGTYFGWNLRRATYGAAERLGRWQGSFIPFPLTRAERVASGDPRLSIAERYSSEDDFAHGTAQAAGELMRDRLLLASDVPAIVERARRAFRRITDGALAGCRFLENL